MKKSIAFLLALVMAFSLAACGDGTADDKTSDNPGTSSENNPVTNAEKSEEIQQSLGGVVDLFDMMAGDCIDTSRKSTANSDERYPFVATYVEKEITTWTPWQTPQGREAAIHWIYEPLFFYLDNYELQPVMAKDWYEEDDTHFVVEIYDYITDTDGNNITAEDVVNSFEAFAHSGNASDFASYASSEAIGTYTVRFTWTEKLTSLTALGSMMETCIFSQKASEDHDFTTDPVGTGPYKLDKLVTGAQYVFEANDDYWQTDELCAPGCKRNVQTIQVDVLSDNTMAYVAFEEGSLFNTKAQTTSLPDFLEGGKYYGQYTVVCELGPGTNGLGFNMSGESIFSDVNMRPAVAYAIDSEGIVAALGSNNYYQLHAEAGESMPGYQEEWKDRENYYSVYDPELAKEYLAKTDYDGETLTLLVQVDDDQERVSQIIEQELKAIGINVSIEILDRAIINTYLYDVTYWDLCMYSWNGDFISQLWGRQSDLRNYTHGFTETGINDPDLQAMIERVQLVEGYTDEQIDEIQTYFTDNCMLYGIFSTFKYNVYNPDLASIVANHGHKDIMLGACDYYLD